MYHCHYNPDDPIEEVNSDDEVTDFHIDSNDDLIKDDSKEEQVPVQTWPIQSASTVPHLDNNEDEDAWLIAANAYDEDKELLVPDQQAPPSPQQLERSLIQTSTI